MFNQEKFNEWEEKTNIPENVMDLVNAVCEKLGVSVYEDTIVMRNRGGYVYAYGKGLHYSYCTSSYESGPECNNSDLIKKWLGGVGFKLVNSYGDNGMDFTTNWQDTFWHYDFLYEPTMVYAEEFEEYDDEDYDDYE